MNVSLTPELTQFVKKKVKSGMFSSASEVVREALRQLSERDRRIQSLRKEIAVGIEQLERGEYTEYDDKSLTQMFERVKSEGRKALAKKRAAS